MGHIPCNKKIIYVGLTRCAKFLLDIKYINHYTEKKKFFVFYGCSEIKTNNYAINQLTPDGLKNFFNVRRK